MSIETRYKLKEINFSCSSHSTEDIERVKIAMLNLLPEIIRDKVEISEIKLRGHAGNEMFLLELDITQNKMIKDLLGYLAAKIQEIDKDSLLQEIDERIDENNCFYVRFNKQDAYNGIITLDDGDNTIRVVIKFIIYKQEPNLLTEALQNFGLIKK
ncbi:MAG: hypothetical protein JXA54_08925 [Candidatus Heimdallarchaeota archaeon]|nr:hypothetical protein [Candidatus Heimdallarchaeota archaeon]